MKARTKATMIEVVEKAASLKIEIRESGAREVIVTADADLDVLGILHFWAKDNGCRWSPVREYSVVCGYRIA